MMGTAHAVSGASLWLTGWSLASVAGLAHPGADVLFVGTVVAAGAALYPDIDHPSSRIARYGSSLTRGIALIHAWLGAHIHDATRMDADRRDADGHRTVTHTVVFASLVGTVCAYIAGRYGPWACAVLVYFFTDIGISAMLARSKASFRNTKIKIGKRRRMSRSVFYAAILAFLALWLVPGNTWWLGLAVGMGCVTHCLGDAITASGCPMFWPLPLPVRRRAYVRGKGWASVRRWQTWYLVGTPRWMRFRVDSPAETAVTWALVVLGLAAVAGLVYAGARPPTS